jgi:cell division protease FtsH
MAASNLLEKLDPALLRPGRFDRQVFVAPPDVGGRRAILEVHTRDKPLRDVDLDAVARQTSGLTGAELANLCNEAAIRCARRGGLALSREDVDRALERVVAGVETRHALGDHEKRVIAFHEGGHALCAELLPSVDRVHKVSIVPRGRALGFTLHLPAEDRHMKTREDLIDHMTCLLGGRVAEQLAFGAVTTGAASDLREVGEIARAMVFEYAMGADDADQRAVLEADGGSDATRRLRDAEQRELVFEALRAARRLLGEHRGRLDAIAAALLEREVLERDDLDALMVGVPRLERRPGVGLRVAASRAADH